MDSLLSKGITYTWHLNKKGQEMEVTQVLPMQLS